MWSKYIFENIAIKNLRIYLVLFSFLLLSLGQLSTTPSVALGGNIIQPWEHNPFYWQFNGKPILLLGGTSNDNLFQYDEKELLEELERLVKNGGNYVRCTMSSRDKGDESPFLNIGGKYDLEKLNPEYWRKFEFFLKETWTRGILVQVEIWDPHDYHRQYWDENHFNPKNNLTFTAAESGLPEEAREHPSNNKCRHPFFRTIPDDLNLTITLKYQRRFVEEILNHTLRYGHILYCISNEFAGSAAWSNYWATVVQGAAEKVGRDVFITEMWDKWDVRSDQHKATLDHPETFKYVDLSQNTHQFGQKHADGILWVKHLLENNPRPLNATKIYGSDEFSNYGSAQEASERFWRNIFCGMASSRFHRPPAGLGNGEIASRHLIAAGRFLQLFEIFEARPATELLRNRLVDEAYCLVGPNDTFAIYFPPPELATSFEKVLNIFWAAEREVTLLAGRQENPLSISWYSIENNRIEKELVASGGAVSLSPPEEGHWIAILRASQ